MKGNMFLGYARGSVGDVVFARSKSQQVGRGRNRRPNNPRTVAQMSQRGLFADAVKFFTRGRQALFQFAFESKRPQESDYNAFMRLNAKNGIILAPNMIADPNFPAIGEWIMSQGSLPEVPVHALIEDSETVWQVDLGVTGSETASALTVGKLSEYLIATGNYEVGDILTFVQISSTSIYEYSEVVPVSPGDSAPEWLIDQIELNTADTRTVESVINEKVITFEKSSKFYFKFALSCAAGDIGAVCCIHSRKTPSGLKVSTQQLMNSPSTTSAVTKCGGNIYRDFVMYLWGASSEAILEGGITHGRH